MDHIVVGPVGVCVIDSKNWTGARLRLDDRGMAVGKWRKDDELHAAKVDAEIVAASLSGITPPVRTCGVLAFVQDMAIHAPVLHQRVFVLQKEQLLPWLRSLPAHLPADDVRRVGAVLEAAHPPRAAANAKTRLPGSSRPPGPVSAARPSPSKARKQAQKRVKLDRELSVLKKKILVVVVALLCLPVLPPAMTWVTEQLGNYLSDAVTPEPTPSPSIPASQSRGAGMR